MATLPAMKLSAYLAQHKITYREMAAKIERDPSEVWRWANGDRVPSLAVAMKIAAATNGEVLPESFVEVVE